MESANRRHGERILVIGAGNFGTCLAQHLAEQGYRVTLACRSAEVAAAIQKSQKNPKYLSSFTLSPRIDSTSKIDQGVLNSVSVVVLATPAQTLREVLKDLKPMWLDRMLMVCAAKGIEMGTLKLPIDIIAEILGAGAADRAVFLSGPSFAAEVMERQPTCVTVAAKVPSCATWAQELFHAAHFRVYTGADPIGVETAGALKNVVAIAAGASVGIGFQMNTRAALITRGLAEITRFGLAMGADPLTFAGLSGVGDLFLTCTSEKSRNFTLGHQLGIGQSLRMSLDALGSVAEGYTTAKAAFELAHKLNVEAPITSAVYSVLYEQKPIAQAVMGLMTRDAKSEL